MGCACVSYASTPLEHGEEVGFAVGFASFVGAHLCGGHCETNLEGCELEGGKAHTRREAARDRSAVRGERARVGRGGDIVEEDRRAEGGGEDGREDLSGGAEGARRK